MRFHNIQALRIVASMGVVSAHLGHFAGALFGASGPLVDLLKLGMRHNLLVPIFFAVSGFVLTHVLRTTRPGPFLFARLLKLYPGYWLAVAVALPLMRKTFWPLESWPISHPTRASLSLLPMGTGLCTYTLGIEWSLIYEGALSACLAALGLLGARRGVPLVAGAWLAVLAAKGVFWPGYGTDVQPTWDKLLLSGYCAPFLCGILAHSLREVGRRWKWAVLGAVAVYVAALPWLWPLMPAWADPDLLWLANGAAGAAVVWLAACLPQLGAGNPLVRLGDYAYGLYLLHVPVILTVLYALKAKGWLVGQWSGIALAGFAALSVGLSFGRLEVAVHGRLRRLTRRDWSGGFKLPTRLAFRFPSRIGRGANPLG